MVIFGLRMLINYLMLSSSKIILRQWNGKFVEGYFSDLIWRNREANNEIPWSVLPVSRLRF
jgi:hypothetical protein